ncbi:hypothetical protein QUC31_015837 [Theobroma cacao]
MSLTRYLEELIPNATLDESCKEGWELQCQMVLLGWRRDKQICTKRNWREKERKRDYPILYTL